MKDNYDVPRVRKLFIDGTNFNIYKTKPKGVFSFKVDEKIAETISILNKKGYYTEHCCQGHDVANPDFKVRENISSIKYLNHFCDIRKLFTPENGYHVLSDDEKGIRSLFIFQGFGAYISFERGVTIPFLPKGFYIDKNFEETLIRREIGTFIIEDGIPKRVSDEVIARNIEQINEDLMEWAKGLDYIVGQEIMRRQI